MNSGNDTTEHLSWRSYYKAVLVGARQEAIAIFKKQFGFEALVTAVGAAVGLVLLSEPTGILVGVIVTLALVSVIIGAWCLIWSPVNITRSSLEEKQALQENISSLQGQLNEGKDKVANAIQELKDKGHLAAFRNFGKGFIKGHYTLWSGFNQDGIDDLLMMKLIRPERIPNPPRPLEPLPPGGIRTGYREPPYLTLWLFTELGAEVWKKIKDEELSGDEGIVT